MKLVRIFTSLAGAGLALGLSFTLMLPAQEPVDPPIEQTEASTAASTTDHDTDSSREDGMRELGGESVAKPDESDAPDTPPELPSAEAVEAADPENKRDEDGWRDLEKNIPIKQHHNRADGREVVQFGSDAVIRAGDSAREVVVFFANALIEGDTNGEAVAIIGNITVNGSIGREAVAILGDVTVNGEVNGEVVAVLGRVRLGPEAVIHGDVVSVGGTVEKAPGSVIKGAVNQIAFMGDGDIDFEWLKAWVKHCLLKGRPLAFGEHLGWAWMIAGCFLGFYLLLALIMPSLVTQCAETMEKRPGMSVLSAMLSLLITPIAMIVLSVTVVGPAVLGLLLFFVGIFGKVVFFGWLGRRITEPAGWKFPALAVLLGGLISTAIYLIPFVGFAFQKFGGFLGTGMVIYTIILSMQSNNTTPPEPEPSPAPSAVPPPMGEGSMGTATASRMGAIPPVSSTDSNPAPAAAQEALGAGTAPRTPPPVPPTAPPAPQLPTQLSTLPRVGFWARLVATFIDIVIVSIVVNMLGVEESLAIWATVYYVVFWALRGTTLGGVVLGIKVVRLDDRPVDWTVAIVRSLGSFLSLCLLGFGFLWVVWDPQRQSWHDKIAGTTVVKMPKGVSLI